MHQNGILATLQSMEMVELICNQLFNGPNKKYEKRHNFYKSLKVLYRKNLVRIYGLDKQMKKSLERDDYIDAYLNGESIPDKDRKVIEQLHERTTHKRQIATQFHFK